MVTQGNISEVAITFTDGQTILYADRCPEGQTTREFLRNLIAELIKSVDAGKTFKHTDNTGTINFNRQTVSSVTITFS